MVSRSWRTRGAGVLLPLSGEATLLRNLDLRGRREDPRSRSARQSLAQKSLLLVGEHSPRARLRIQKKRSRIARAYRISSAPNRDRGRPRFRKRRLREGLEA